MKSDQPLQIIVIASKKSQAESTAQMWIKAKGEFGNRPLEAYISIVGEGYNKLKHLAFGKNTLICLMAEDEEEWKRVTD